MTKKILFLFTFYEVIVGTSLWFMIAESDEESWQSSIKRVHDESDQGIHAAVDCSMIHA